MSVGQVSGSPIMQQPLQPYFDHRRADMVQLGKDLKSGDLQGAEQAYESIVSLGQHGPFKGAAFAMGSREQDFQAIGQAIQSGDLSAAAQAYKSLAESFKAQPAPVPAPAPGPSPVPPVADPVPSAS